MKDEGREGWGFLVEGNEMDVDYRLLDQLLDPTDHFLMLTNEKLRTFIEICV